MMEEVNNLKFGFLYPPLSRAVFGILSCVSEVVQ